VSASSEQPSAERAIVLTGDLHARPAGAVAVAAARFESSVSVSAGGTTANARSVLSVLSLGATSGQHVVVAAAGPDAAEAVDALIAILGEATKMGGLFLRTTEVRPPLPLHPREGAAPSGGRPGIRGGPKP
jgi:phosphocarrier protein HPr